MFTWEDLLKAAPTERRKLWNQLHRDFPEAVGYWEDNEGCHEDTTCQYYKNGWCSLQEHPVAFNPYFSPRTGLIGMACMGMRPPQQLRLI